MVPTSSNYKKFVYNKAPYELDARHFLPQALIKIIDVAARDVCSYTASSTAFYSEFTELTDDITKQARAWGTLEDGQFLLNGTIQLMPDDAAVIQQQQNGFVSEEMSDATGSINVTLTCRYTQQISTIGRTLFFDSSYDAVPSDFTIIYYRTGTEIAREEARGNNAYMYTSNVAVSRYDQIVITFTKTTRPYRRIHLAEDIPGIYITYADKDIVSLNITQSIDIFSEELTVGEIDLTVQNITKQLDILNAEGLEHYLQRRQPVEIRLNLIFPDDSVESILVASWELSTWKSNKGALDATFTIRDPIDKLTSGEYIKGVLPSSFVSFYDLAKAVLDDAGVKKYIIDSELHNVYTKACLPIAEHKELLRMIAQAAQSVVIPRADGSVHIKYISPLVYGYNILTDGAFNKTDIWTFSNAALSTDYLYIGSNCVKMGTPTSYVAQTVNDLTAGHIYYGRFYAMPTVALAGQSGIAGMYIDDILTSVNIQTANLSVEEWSAISCRFTHNATSMSVKIQSTLPADILYVDGIMICDLTLIYGAGNEPTQEWCDSNIRFIADTMLIPRAKDPVPVDNLDYNVLIDAPEIETSEAVKSVETSIYSYEIASEASEVYKGVRVINGTEEFTIKFSSIAAECTADVTLVDDDGNAAEGTVTLLSQDVYSRAAVLKVRATGNVQIIVTGKKVTQATSTYKVDADIEPSLVADAIEKVIDNELITYRAVAENVTSFAVYWYGRRYKYSFDWRQNPAVELLDTVTVHDDFKRDNGVYITDRELEYNNGVLSGNSKGVY